MYASTSSEIARGLLAARRRLAETLQDERGDVPGWAVIAIHI